MRPSSFHYVVISYFIALTVKAQETPEGLSALHTGWRGRRREEGRADRQEETTPLHPPPPTTETTMGARMVLSSETMDADARQMQRPEEGLRPGDQGQDPKGQEGRGPLGATLSQVLKYKQSWPRGIVEIAIINSEGAPGGASFSIIVVGLVSHSSNRISKVQVLPPGAPLETHYFKAPQ